MRVFTIVGYKNSGKTSFICSLIPIFQSKGLCVGILKHHIGNFSFDHQGTDTFRFSESGARVIAISGPEKLALIKNSIPFDPEPLDLAKSFFQDVDILILEGYKHTNLDKYPIIKDKSEISYWISSFTNIAGFISGNEKLIKHKNPIPIFPFSQPHTFVNHILGKKEL